MKVLMVLDREFPPDLRVENEIETLTAQGIEIHLACFTRKQLQPLEQNDSLWIHRKPISSLTYKSSVAALTFPSYFNFWKKFLEALTSAYTFDAIHIHDLPLLQVGLQVAEKKNIPVIADLHENWPAYLRIAQHTQKVAGKILSPNRKWVHYEYEMVKKANHIIVVVKEAKERLINMGISAEKISIVSNTLNLAHVNLPDDVQKDMPPVLFYAGGINYHRGLQTVIEAMAHSNNHSYRLVALGEGKYKKSLIALAEKTGVSDRVSFPGWKPYHEMLQWMSKSEFALIPHIKSDHTNTTIPHKLFQYMFAGIPVIASDCAPIKRIIEETDAGMVFPSNNPYKLATLLDNIDLSVTHTMGNNGRNWVRKKYNWVPDAIELVSLYQEKLTN